MELLEQVFEVASGVDALYLSGSTKVPQRVLSQLAEAKRAAQADSEPVDFDLGGEGTFFQVSPGSFGKYPYRLEHPYGLMGITNSLSLPAIRVQPRSEFLHALGPDVAVAWFMLEASQACGGIDAVAWNVARLDLFCDVQGWDLAHAVQEHFVSRSDAFGIFGTSHNRTGFTFGKRGAQVYARIYDKTLEAAGKPMFAVWEDLWAASGNYAPGAPVWRIEFELKGALVRQLVRGTPEDVLAGAGGLWGYVADEWLTYRVPSADSNRSRWPVSEEWAVVQAASLRGEALGLERVRDRLLTYSLRALIPPLRGYVASVGALMDSPTLADALHSSLLLIEGLGRRDGRMFEDLMLAKRDALRLT